MDKKTVQKFKKRLEEDKKFLEKEIYTFIQKEDKKTKNRKVKFPDFNDESTSGSEVLEIGMDEVEEYGNQLSIEQNLEKRLKDINIALEKIKKGKYGKCENCKKEISQKRLNACPEAKMCDKCI